MIYLKIEDNKGYYQLGLGEWSEIDKIDKDDLLVLLNKAIETDFEMNGFEPEILGNKAHQIIYKNLYEKFSELLENKDRFKDESEQLYKKAIEKYSEIKQNESQG